MRSFFLSRTFTAAALLITLCALIAGCSGSAPTPTLAPVFPTSAGDPPVETAAAPSPEPSATLYPSQTPLPTATFPPAPTATATAVPSPTPDPALSSVKLAGLSWLAKYKYNLLVSLDFPGPVNPADYRVTFEDKEYLCEVLAQFPNRLYCNGQGGKVLSQGVVRIYPAGSSQPGFEQKVTVPYFDNNYQLED